MGMPRSIVLPPDSELLPDGAKRGGWWHEMEDERIVCDLCPRQCSLKAGDRGFCFVRENREGEMVLATYGRSTGFCVDPIEKKPLNHFLPGTAVLSFGTAGCNLGCKFCQNWDISKSREVERLSERASPEMVAAAAKNLGCRSVAYTYNDPVIWAEYAIDVAAACRDLGIKSVVVTAGYMSPESRGPFFHAMDAANVDLKAFREEFYFKLTQSHIQPVLDTLVWLKKETDVWFEITNLLIPRENDGGDELKQMCQWILDHLGDEIPVHFTAFHPDFRLKDRERTSHETLLDAFRIAQEAGIKFVYVGNVDDTANQSTYCPSCRKLLIERNWHDLGRYNMQENRCGHCGAEIAGVFEQRPGDWGRKRLPVRISDYAPRTDTSIVSRLNKKKDTTSEKNMASQTTNAPPVQLNDQQNHEIHSLACNVVGAAILGQSFDVGAESLSGAAELPIMGAFVTLKRKGRLRACCGFLSMEKTTNLRDAVQHAALRTATQDGRFPTISLTELPHLSVDVQLLHSPKRMTEQGQDRIDAVKVGRHGLQIHRGKQGGLLLPAVAVENNLDSEEFLRQVCMKAGLPTTAWQEDDTVLLTFEGESIPGPFTSSCIGDGARCADVFRADEMRTLTEHCKTNLVALARGATPNYYLSGCSDATVPGVILRVSLPGRSSDLDLAKLSLRDGVPVQATLFSLVEAAAPSLRSVAPQSLNDVVVTVSILHDPAMHGTVEATDLAGLDTSRRGLLVVETNKTCWVFDPEKTPEGLLEATLEAANVRSPESVGVYSVAVHCSAPNITFVSGPRPTVGPAQRPPAVAGSFYPGQAGELAAMVDEALGEPAAVKEKWPAVMLPHAGLKYSGRIAAQTLSRVEIPETVIVIGPKHTRHGMDWAVAPHLVWSLPGGDIAADPELAKKLAAAVDGLELDAAAHQREHAVEVELPFLARLAPGTRVVGIVMGGGSRELCRQFGADLASVIQEMDPPPLLIISSDMNHYAPDEENRRLDELALEAMESLDADQLHSTVRRHSISMCGVLPAVVVMDTLKQLGTLSRIERVGYATSGDVSGDKSRVVGYAGMLIG